MRSVVVALVRPVGSPRYVVRSVVVVRPVRSACGRVGIARLRPACAVASGVRHHGCSCASVRVRTRLYGLKRCKPLFTSRRLQWHLYALHGRLHAFISTGSPGPDGRGVPTDRRRMCNRHWHPCLRRVARRAGNACVPGTGTYVTGIGTCACRRAARPPRGRFPTRAPAHGAPMRCGALRDCAGTCGPKT